MKAEESHRRSDIDIAVTGVDDFDRLVESIEELPTLYSVDIVNMDTCKNELLLRDMGCAGNQKNIFLYMLHSFYFV